MGILVLSTYLSPFPITYGHPCSTSLRSDFTREHYIRWTSTLLLLRRPLIRLTLLSRACGTRICPRFYHVTRSYVCNPLLHLPGHHVHNTSCYHIFEPCLPKPASTECTQCLFIYIHVSTIPYGHFVNRPTIWQSQMSRIVTVCHSFPEASDSKCDFETNLPNHQKNEISTFSLSISFVQAQLCAYSIKTKYCEVDNVMDLNLSPVE